MSTFREQLRALQSRPGIGAVVAAGRDGLLIDHAARSPASAEVPDGVAPEADADSDGPALARAEHLAALAPGLLAAAEMVADAQGGGGLRAVVVEGDAGLLVVLPLTPDVTVLATVDAAHAEAAAAIGAVRSARGVLAEAV